MNLNLNKKWLIISLVAVGLGGLYYLNESNYPRVYVAKETIPKGTRLEPSLFTEEKVLSRSTWMIGDGERSYITDTYAHNEIPKGEFASKNIISKSPIVPYKQGEGTIGVKASNQEEVVGWQLQKGDLVAISSYDRDKRESFVDPQLTNIVVDALINRDGKDIAFVSDKDKTNVSTINLKVTPEQAKLIDQYQKRGSITLIRQGGAQ